MNKLFLWLLLFPLCVVGQVEKGKYYVQTSISLQTTGNVFSNSNGTTGDISSTLPLSQVGIGRFLTDKQSVHIFVLGSLGTSDVLGFSKNYTIGMGMGYNLFHPINKEWGLLLNNELSYRIGQSSANKNVSNSEEYLQKLNIANAKISPGLYYVFFNKILVQASIDWFNLSYIKVQNNPNLPLTSRQQASKSLEANGLFPGPFQLSNISLKFSYIFP
jgi:hypothetical protein